MQVVVVAKRGNAPAVAAKPLRRCRARAVTARLWREREHSPPNGVESVLYRWAVSAGRHSVQSRRCDRGIESWNRNGTPQSAGTRLAEHCRKVNRRLRQVAASRVSSQEKSAAKVDSTRVAACKKKLERALVFVYGGVFVSRSFGQLTAFEPKQRLRLRTRVVLFNRLRRLVDVLPRHVVVAEFALAARDPEKNVRAQSVAIQAAGTPQTVPVCLERIIEAVAALVDVGEIVKDFRAEHFVIERLSDFERLGEPLDRQLVVALHLMHCSSRAKALRNCRPVLDAFCLTVRLDGERPRVANPSLLETNGD